MYNCTDHPVPKVYPAPQYERSDIIRTVRWLLTEFTDVDLEKFETRDIETVYVTKERISVYTKDATIIFTLTEDVEDDDE